eukprot:197601-Chlamydomonas_euryale.AAC.1
MSDEEQDALLSAAAPLGDAADALGDAAAREALASLPDDQLREYVDAALDKYGTYEFADATLLQPLLLDAVREALPEADAQLLGKLLVRNAASGDVGAGLNTHRPRELRRAVARLRLRERRALPGLLARLESLRDEYLVKGEWKAYMDNKLVVRMARRAAQKGLLPEQQQQQQQQLQEQQQLRRHRRRKGEGTDEDDAGGDGDGEDAPAAVSKAAEQGRQGSRRTVESASEGGSASGAASDRMWGSGWGGRRGDAAPDAAARVAEPAFAAAAAMASVAEQYGSPNDWDDNLELGGGPERARLKRLSSEFASAAVALLEATAAGGPKDRSGGSSDGDCANNRPSDAGTSNSSARGSSSNAGGRSSGVGVGDGSGSSSGGGAPLREALASAHGAVRDLGVVAATGSRSSDPVVRDTADFLSATMLLESTGLGSGGGGGGSGGLRGAPSGLSDLVQGVAEAAAQLARFLAAAEVWHQYRQFYPAAVDRQLSAMSPELAATQHLPVLHALQASERWWIVQNPGGDRSGGGDGAELSAAGECLEFDSVKVDVLAAADALQLRFLTELLASEFDERVLLKVWDGCGCVGAGACTPAHRAADRSAWPSVAPGVGIACEGGSVGLACGEGMRAHGKIPLTCEHI